MADSGLKKLSTIAEGTLRPANFHKTMLTCKLCPSTVECAKTGVDLIYRNQHLHMYKAMVVACLLLRAPLFITRPLQALLTPGFPSSTCQFLSKTL
jgi:hypothetical protein